AIGGSKSFPDIRTETPEKPDPSVAVILAMSEYRNRTLPPSPSVLEQFAHLEGQPGMAYARAIIHDLKGETQRYLLVLSQVPKEDPWFGLAQAELKVANGTDLSAMQRWLAALDKRLAAPTEADVSRVRFLHDLRGVCLQTTARLQRRHEHLAKQLQDATSQQDSYTAAAAAAMLGSLGPEAAESMPALARLLGHDVAHV